MGDVALVKWETQARKLPKSSGDEQWRLLGSQEPYSLIRVPFLVLITFIREPVTQKGQKGTTQLPRL